MEEIIAYLEKIWLALRSLDFVSTTFVSDFLDILLVTFIIYEGIKIIRGSRTFQVIKGIGFLIAVFLIVKLLHMEASEYLLSVLFENALIILVILFSPELRSMLERVGRRSIKDISLFNFGNSEERERVITATVNDFCKAAAELSETKTGALVVFEREAPLQDVIKSGTVLDACSSPQLFNGLFFKNSALHDGAVVVRDGRIYAAGCILPLTHETSIDSNLGTRHRAAIGMSEQSDAVAVIVSEETGAISVAVEGRLEHGVQTGRLREVLLEMLATSKEDTKSKTGKKLFSGKGRKNGGGENEK